MCSEISLTEQLTTCAPNFDATVPTAAGNILSLMAPLARWAALQFCWNDMSELPHCCVGSSGVSIHTYLHTCILYVRGLCHVHLRLGPYRHHTSQTSFCSNSVRHMQELEAFRHAAACIPTENETQMETCIAQTMLFSDRSVGHCREGEHSHVACGWQAPKIGKCARNANVSKLR